MTTASGTGDGAPHAAVQVSVIIPTYNRAHCVARAVHSVLGQTFADFEVIVIDDGSSDDTRQVIGRLSDPRIRYIELPENRGVAAARNEGLRAARGEFIAFLDSDDEWMQEKLELQVQLLRRSPPSVGLVYTGVETLDAHGRSQVDIPRFRGDIHSELLLRNVLHGGGSNVILRRSAVEAAGEFDETIPAIEDYDYWVRVARSFDVEFVPSPLIRYHDPVGTEERKSLNMMENVQAREYFFTKYRDEMREAGVAHRFLMESARRHSRAWNDDVAGARRLAIRAALEKPLWWEPYSFLLGTLPKPLVRVLGQARRFVQRTTRTG